MSLVLWPPDEERNESHRVNGRRRKSKIREVKGERRKEGEIIPFLLPPTDTYSDNRDFQLSESY